METALETLRRAGLSEAEVAHPSPAFVQSAFEALRDAFFPTAAARAAAVMQPPAAGSVVPQQMTLLRLVAPLVALCGIKDFMLRDLTRPHPDRFRRQLVAIGTYAEWRKSLLDSPCASHLVECREVLESIEQLEKEKAQRSERVRSIEAELEPERDKYGELARESDEISNKVRSRYQEYLKYNETLRSRKGEVLRLSAERSRLDALVSARESDIEVLRAFLANPQHDPSAGVESLENELRGLRERLERAHARALALTAAHKVAGQLVELMVRASASAKKALDAQVRHEELGDVNKTVQESVAQAKKQASEANARAAALENAIEMLGKQASVAERELDELASARAELRAQIEAEEAQALAEIKVLEEETARAADELAEAQSLHTGEAAEVGAALVRLTDADAQLDAVLERVARDLDVINGGASVMV